MERTDPLLCFCCLLALFPHPAPQLMSSHVWVVGRGGEWSGRGQGLWASPPPHSFLLPPCPRISGTCDLSQTSGFSPSYHSRPFIIWLPPYALHTCQVGCTSQSSLCIPASLLYAAYCPACCPVPPVPPVPSLWGPCPHLNHGDTLACSHHVQLCFLSIWVPRWH